VYVTVVIGHSLFSNFFYNPLTIVIQVNNNYPALDEKLSVVVLTCLAKWLFYVFYVFDGCHLWPLDHSPRFAITQQQLILSDLYFVCSAHIVI